MAAAPATRRIPVAIRITALWGFVLTAAYAALYMAVRSVDPGAAASMLRMYGLTIVAGRETAMFDALERGLPPLWVYGLSVIDDVGSLLLALPFTWIVVRVLKQSHRIRWAIARFEKQALLRRHWVRRWGLPGLALVYFLPGFGAGVPVTVLLGVLARIPFSALVPFFIVATLIVDGLWALTLMGVVRALPDAPWVSYVPLAVVTLVLSAGAIGAWRGRASRHVALLDWPAEPGGADEARLRAVGITMRDGLVHADLDALRASLGGQERHMGRLLATAELLLLQGLAPRDAVALGRAGVSGLEDVAGSDPQRLAQRLAAAGLAGAPGQAEAWVAQARALVEAQHAGWRRGRPR